VKSQKILPRVRANLDVEEAIDFYLREAGEKVALGFVDALERAYAQIARHPATGSLRYAYELNLPGLRTWPLQRYPHLIFYLERADHIDVWRVLHGKRDLPVWLQEEGA
jgi:toxin ParE1/3/4